jgi:hypothetical protein
MSFRVETGTVEKGVRLKGYLRLRGGKKFNGVNFEVEGIQKRVLHRPCNLIIERHV